MLQLRQMFKNTLGFADHYWDACDQPHLTAHVDAPQTPQSTE